jgi:RNA-directed DNA polymerase
MKLSTREIKWKFINLVGERVVLNPAELEGGVNMTTEYILEQMLNRHNLNQAYLRVKTNKGSHGVDGMRIEDAFEYLKANRDQLIQSIERGTYRPQPVRRVEIDKPDGGKRRLGIPTVVDRIIQQALTQVLTPHFEKIFSDHSYGFRPGRNQHQALLKAKGYVEEGYIYVVDIDLEKFFDRVNHDILMSRVARIIKDKRALKLIRAYLNSGNLENGVVVKDKEGTPQGGPISPLLSNIMLHDLDMELEKRGLRFVRFADDCNIYVKSPRAAERVMKGITEFIEKKLKLKVNQEKSQVNQAF